MAMLAGAFGIGTVIGPFLAPLFIYPMLGRAGPLFTFALIAAAMLFTVWRYLPESVRRPEAEGTPKTRRGRNSEGRLPSAGPDVARPARRAVSGDLLVRSSRPARRRSTRPWAS